VILAIQQLDPPGGLANVQKGVSNFMLSFATTGDHLSSDSAQRLYDMTQLKQRVR
jgi:hypothetical protein